MPPRPGLGRAGGAALLARMAAITILALTGTVAARADDANPQPPETVTGAGAWGRIVGNTVTGVTPDGPYVEYFAADGSLRVVDGDGKANGRWVMRDTKLCTTVDDDEEECRALDVTGAKGAFIDDAGNRYGFDILPGNPKGL